MEYFPWWNEKQKQLMKETKSFADEKLPKGEEISWTKAFPKNLLEETAKRGWFGALIPKEFGGIGTGVTGCCIVAEQLSRICSALTGAYSVTMFGGTEQLLKFGTEEQKKRWLPGIAKGMLAAICITEPDVGSDASSIETTARQEADEYVINGKKRFITNAGVAGIYLVYAKISDRSEDKSKYKHLNALIVEKNTAGLSVERINELGGWVGLPNGYLDFNEVRVPVENRIGQDGDGWKVLVEGLNFERTLFAAGMLGPMKEALRYAIGHSQRRIQFERPTIDWEVNQFKIADIIAKLMISRLTVYYAAYLMDLNAEAVLEATLAKLYTPESYERVLTDASQVMGGDGWTKFYPIENFLRDARVNQIGAGTSEVMRMVIFRQGLKTLEEDLKMPARTLDKKLNVPISTPKPAVLTETNEENVLLILAEDYQVNPGLYMSREDIKKRFANINDEQIDMLLISLESKGLAKLYKDKKGTIKLAKATYAGLRKARPLEYYRWFPEWLDKELIF
ncbi:MAG: acyl-CoA/acyl-ACP dehydrogenase [Candidatus Bathyarchaeota archaeon]|nr:acyl-CoA/acyl-ACP dehydrogenase [Candidatus Bathyarchaeota archaeon]MDH5786835.1 acyl-CoA/acyl-ACP dehydrogenase [Candidatus Bathyarchaeota archaeon]